MQRSPLFHAAVVVALALRHMLNAAVTEQQGCARGQHLRMFMSDAGVSGGNARNPPVTCARVQSHFDCLNVGVTMCAQAGSR